jgi:hypothetical protein
MLQIDVAKIRKVPKASEKVARKRKRGKCGASTPFACPCFGSD